LPKTLEANARIVAREQVFQRGDLPLGVLRVTRHASCEVHRHDFSELVIVFRGTAIHEAPGGKYPISAGDVFVLHGDQAHAYMDPEHLDLVNILFDMEKLGLPRADLAGLPGYHVLFTLEPRYRDRDRFESRLRLSPDQLVRIEGLVDRLERELAERKAGSGFMAIANFMLILGQLSRHYADAQTPSAESLQQLGRAIGYLERHYAEKVTLDELAEAGRMSRRSLTRAFRAAMGCSPIEYQIRLRVRHAVTMLQEGAARISDVAFRVGFRDSNYFSRQFRSVMGVSPTDFMASLSQRRKTTGQALRLSL